MTTNSTIRVPTQKKSIQTMARNNRAQVYKHRILPHNLSQVIKGKTTKKGNSFQILLQFQQETLHITTRRTTR